MKALAAARIEGFSHMASHKFPGHQERLEEHRHRIYGHPCPCGSGMTYGKCCLTRHDQEARELKARGEWCGDE